MKLATGPKVWVHIPEPTIGEVAASVYSVTPQILASGPAAAKDGFGLTVILKLVGMPSHAAPLKLYTGVTVIVACKSEVPVFVAVNADTWF